MPGKVAIIGAGYAGLSALDASLEEGLLPTVFEKQADVGGIWASGNPVCYDSVKLNQSHFQYQFSRFPWPEGSPWFPTKSQVGQYFRDFVDAFDLRQYIRFNTAAKVEREGDRWSVNGEVFDFLIVATGSHMTAAKPLKELAGYSGRTLTMEQYFNPMQEDGAVFKGKKVLVIGGNLSGPEIAMELGASGVPASVTMLKRSPVWHLTRTSQGHGLPMDLFLNRWATTEEEVLPLVATLHPPPTGALSIEGAALDEVRLGVCDGLPQSIAAGQVRVKTAGLTGATGSVLGFSDGTEEEFDVVVSAVGMVVDFSFLPQPVRDGIGWNPEAHAVHAALHELTWPVNEAACPNAAFVGIHNLYISYYATNELQSRWAAAVFSGRVKRDPEEAVAASARAHAERMQRPWVGQFNLEPLPLPELPAWMARVGKKLGCYPEEVLSDEAHPLHVNVKSGPTVPYCLRLVGPGAMPERAAAQIKRLEELFRLHNLRIDSLAAAAVSTEEAA